jgi:hypothetical protein
VSLWTELGSGHRVQVLADGVVLGEHDTLPGYWVPRHLVSPEDGATWETVRAEPLTLSPSLHCATENGGCGVHGFVRDGQWHDA